MRERETVLGRVEPSSMIPSGPLVSKAPIRLRPPLLVPQEHCQCCHWARFCPSPRKSQEYRIFNYCCKIIASLHQNQDSFSCCLVSQWHVTFCKNKCQTLSIAHYLQVADFLNSQHIPYHVLSFRRLYKQIVASFWWTKRKELSQSLSLYTQQ